MKHSTRKTDARRVARGIGNAPQSGAFTMPPGRFNRPLEPCTPEGLAVLGVHARVMVDASRPHRRRELEARVVQNELNCSLEDAFVKVGLSTSHISPPAESPRELVTYLGGTLTQVKGNPQGTLIGGGMRQAVTGFSADSRRRLTRKMASINEPEVAPERYFVTLTYPGRYPACGREWKRHLDVFLKRLKRACDYQAVVWKLEPQQRMAPHFHLLVFTHQEIDRAWLAQAWYEVVGTGLIEHLHAGTQCDRVRTWRGVLSYAAKYLGKVTAANLPAFWRDAGRWWGVRGKLPIEAITHTLTRQEFVRVRRVMRKAVEKATGRKVKLRSAERGLSVMLSDASAIRLMAWSVQAVDGPGGLERTYSTCSVYPQCRKQL